MSNAPPSPMTELDVARLLSEHQAGVWRYLRALGCEAAQAEDLTQETFLAVLEKPFEYHGPAAAGGYLRRVAHNLFISAQRRAGKVKYVSDFHAFETVWEDRVKDDQGEMFLDALNDCVEQLTPRAKMSLQMRFRDNRSRQEIADRLQITQHGAKNLMQRAKKQLRECVEQKLN